jgi:hypothetical protein
MEMDAGIKIISLPVKAASFQLQYPRRLKKDNKVF